MSSPTYFVELINLTGEKMSCIVSCTPAIVSGAGDWFEFREAPSLAVAFLWEPWDHMRRGMVGSPSDEARFCSLWYPYEREEAVRRAGQAYLGRVMPNEWSPTLYLDFAPQVFARVEIRDRRRCGRVLRVAEPLPECTFDITPTDPRFLEHMVVGMRWDTTAYAMESASLPVVRPSGTDS